MSVIYRSKVAGIHVHIYTYNKQSQQTSVFVLGSFHDFCASQRCRRMLLWSFFTLYTYIATGIRTGSLFFLVLEHHQQFHSCALSHRYPAREPKHAHPTWLTALPSVRFTKMADLHNDVIMQVGHCIRTRYKYSQGHCICGVVLFRK